MAIREPAIGSSLLNDEEGFSEHEKCPVKRELPGRSGCEVNPKATVSNVSEVPLSARALLVAFNVASAMFSSITKSPLESLSSSLSIEARGRVRGWRSAIARMDASPSRTLCRDPVLCCLWPLPSRTACSRPWKAPGTWVCKASLLGFRGCRASLPLFRLTYRDLFVLKRLNVPGGSVALPCSDEAAAVKGLKGIGAWWH